MRQLLASVANWLRRPSLRERMEQMEQALRVHTGVLAAHLEQHRAKRDFPDTKPV